MHKYMQGQQTPTHNHKFASKSPPPLKCDTSLSIERVGAPCKSPILPPPATNQPLESNPGQPASKQAKQPLQHPSLQPPSPQDPSLQASRPAE